MEQEEKANAKNDAEQAEVEKVKYLDSEAQYLDPSFMMAWWNLRQHIEKYELTYFFEVKSISKICSLPIHCALNDYTADESNRFL